MDINIKGVIVGNDDKDIYDYFGIENTAPKDVARGLNEANNSAVVVNINSGGGDVFSGSEIYTTLKDYTGDVHVKISGLAASAASVVAMSGDKVSISPTANIMIHNAKSSVDGDNRDMEHYAEVLKTVNESIANAYVLKTKQPKDEILNLMNKETWLNAEKAKDLNFVDEILFDTKGEISNNKAYDFAASINNLLPQEVLTQTREMLAKKEKENQNKQYNMRLKYLKMSKKTNGG